MKWCPQQRAGRSEREGETGKNTTSPSRSDVMVVHPGTRVPDRPREAAGRDIANARERERGVHTDPRGRPAQFLRRRLAVEALDLDVLVGPAVVVEVTGPGDVGLDAVVDGAERLLFKTRNSAAWAEECFFEDYASISPEAAARLVEGRKSAWSASITPRSAVSRPTRRCCGPA